MPTKLIPAPGKVVIDPDTKPPRALKAEGENRELNSYWIRRLQDGDVSEFQETAPAAAAAAPTKPKKGTSEGK